MADFHEYCRTLADSAIAAYMRELCPQLYLYGRRRADRAFVELQLCRDGAEPGDLDLVLTEPLPLNLTAQQLYEWLKRRLKYEPILPALKSA